MSGTCGAVRWLGVLAAAAWLGSGGAPAGALSLGDLAGGESFTTGNGVTFANFEIRVRGKLSRDLDDYRVVKTDDGFFVTGDVVGARRGPRAGRGRIQLRYDVATGDPSGLVEGVLGVQPGDGHTLVSAKKKLFDDRGKLGKLSADSVGGGILDQLELGGVGSLHVRERIRLQSGFAGGAVNSGFTVVPEPGTGALLGLGAALAAGAARRRAR
jgi:hypothetical protein